MLKGLWIALGVALAITVFGFIPLMGIPDALVFGVLSPLADLVYGRGTVQGLKGDTMWPIAILIPGSGPSASRRAICWPGGFFLGWAGASA